MDYEALLVRHPQGLVVSDLDETRFHLARNWGTEYPHRTICGRETDAFPTRAGTAGIELGEWEIQFHMDRGLRPCGRCWGQRWRSELTSRAEAHGARRWVA